MKLRYVLALAALATTVAFTSCKKDEKKDDNKKTEEPKKTEITVTELAGEYKGEKDAKVTVVAEGENAIKVTYEALDGLKDLKFDQDAQNKMLFKAGEVKDKIKAGATATFEVKENAKDKAKKDYTLTIAGKKNDDSDITFKGTMTK